MSQIFDQGTAKTLAASTLAVGQTVRIIHRPTHGGPDIIIEATVIRIDPPYCYVDTLHQRSLCIQQRHLSQA